MTHPKYFIQYILKKKKKSPFVDLLFLGHYFKLNEMQMSPPPPPNLYNLYKVRVF